MIRRRVFRLTKLSFSLQNQDLSGANEKTTQQEDSDSEDELDVLPEGQIDVKKYDNFKLVKT